MDRYITFRVVCASESLYRRCVELTPDQRIGRNIQALRGDMTQSDLAAGMRERGWKWTQPTVTSVEKGDRPLRLAEAVSLSEILEVGPRLFAEAPAHVDAVLWSGRIDEAVERMNTIVEQIYHYQWRLAGELALVANEQNNWWIQSHLARSVPQFALEGLVSALSKQDEISALNALTSDQEVLHGDPLFEALDSFKTYTKSVVDALSNWKPPDFPYEKFEHSARDRDGEHPETS